MKTYSTSLRNLAFAAAGLFLLAGCASTSQIEVNRKAPERAYRVVNVISGPDQAGDVSAALEAALQQHGFATRINSSEQDRGTLIARYKDTWKRNGVTFLNRLSIELLDADSNALLVSSNWQNSGVRQFQSVPEVVDGLVASMLSRLPNNYKPVAKATDKSLKTVSLNALNQKQ
jgi:hypothetical protein